MTALNLTPVALRGNQQGNKPPVGRQRVVNESAPSRRREISAAGFGEKAAVPLEASGLSVGTPVQRLGVVGFAFERVVPIGMPSVEPEEKRGAEISGQEKRAPAGVLAHMDMLMFP